MQKIPLDYLVETIAKALCFEKYVAINKIEDFESVDLEAASDYYEERADQYLNKYFAMCPHREKPCICVNKTFSY